MANIETMWVSDENQLQATVETLIGRGGTVQGQHEGEVFLHLKKRQVLVKIGRPGGINTDKAHWYNEPAETGASPGTVAPPPAPPTPSGPPLSTLPPPPNAPPVLPAANPDPSPDAPAWEPPPPPPATPLAEEPPPPA